MNGNGWYLQASRARLMRKKRRRFLPAPLPCHCRSIQQVSFDSQVDSVDQSRHPMEQQDADKWLDRTDSMESFGQKYLFTHWIDQWQSLSSYLPMKCPWRFHRRIVQSREDEMRIWAKHSHSSAVLPSITHVLWSMYCSPVTLSTCARHVRKPRFQWKTSVERTGNSMFALTTRSFRFWFEGIGFHFIDE